MDLFKITFLVSLLLGKLQSKGISWNRPFAYFGDLGFRKLHSIVPGMPLDQRTTIPLFRHLPESQEAVVEEILPELDHLMPFSGEESLKTEHIMRKRSTEVGANHREEQTSLKSIKETKYDESVMGTHIEVRRGLNDVQDNSDVNESHQILIDIVPETNTVGNTNQIMEKEFILDDRYGDTSNKSTKPEEFDVHLVDTQEGDENVMTAQTETESTMSIPYDNGNITSDNSSLEKASPDILVEIENTEYSYITVKSDFSKETDNSMTNEGNKCTNKDPVTEDSETENYRASERRSCIVPTIGMRRSLPGGNKHQKLKNAQRKIKSRTQYKQQLNPAVLCNLVTSTYRKGKPKYFVPEQLRSGSNYFIVPADAYNTPPSIPFGVQRLSGIPGPKSRTSQRYDAWLNKFGSIPASSLHQNWDGFWKYSVKPPQQLPEYGKSVQSHVNAVANDPLLMSLYRYIQRPYNDGLTFGSGQFGGKQYGSTNANKRRFVWKKPMVSKPLIFVDLL